MNLPVTALTPVSYLLVHGFANERKQGNLSGSFDANRQFALMFGTGAGDSSGNDFAALCNELSQCLGFFVIYFKITIHTESAYFPTLVESTFTTASLVFTIHIFTLRS